MIQNLQIDPVPLVRSQAVYMTGHILATFFDFIPVRVSQIFISTLVSSLSKDRSSVDVRYAAMQAIEKILSNPLSHPLLKEMLPELSHSIHDTSDRVRTGFVRILLAVKANKGLKVHEIVDIDNLLAQLEVEKGEKLAKQMTELILDSFFPYGEKSSKQLIRRCIHLVQVNPLASKKFYAMVVKFVSRILFIAHPQVPPGPITKFINRLWTSCLAKWIISRRAAQEMGEEIQDLDDGDRGDSGEGQGKRRKKSTTRLSSSDVAAVATIFNIMALCWEGIHPELQHKDHEPLQTVVLLCSNSYPFLVLSHHVRRCNFCVHVSRLCT